MKLNLLLGYSSLWDVKPQFGETTGKKRSPTVTDRNCDNVSSTLISGFYAFNKIRIIVILLHVNWFFLLFFFPHPSTYQLLLKQQCACGALWHYNTYPLVSLWPSVYVTWGVGAARRRKAVTLHASPSRGHLELEHRADTWSWRVAVPFVWRTTRKLRWESSSRLCAFICSLPHNLFKSA